MMEYNLMSSFHNAGLIWCSGKDSLFSLGSAPDVGTSSHLSVNIQYAAIQSYTFIAQFNPDINSVHKVLGVVSGAEMLQEHFS